MEKNEVQELFPHELFINIIFPFKFSKISFEEIKRKCSENDLKPDEKFITGNSRHFDYIENLFFSKNSDDKKQLQQLGIALHVEDKNAFESQIKEYIDEKDKKILLEYKLLDVKFIVFNTKLLFVAFKYKTYKNNQIEDFFDKLSKIKKVFKNMSIIPFIKKFFQHNDIMAFDMQEEGKTSRFQIFTEIKVGTNKKKDNENTTLVRYLSPDQISVLANYFINRNTLKDKRYALYEKNDSISMFFGNEVFCSEEGIVSITEKNQFNWELVMRTYDATIQNLFYSYILVLHQFFYLHYLKILLQELDLKNKNISDVLYDINMKYTIFRTKWLYNKVSQFKYQETLYQYIYDKYSIEVFSEEIKDATEPLVNLLNERRTKRLDIIVKIFTSVTITNAIFNLTKGIFELFENHCLTKSLIIGIVIPILFAALYLILISLKYALVQNKSMRNNHKSRKK